MILDRFIHPINMREDIRELLKGCFTKYLSKQMVVYDVGCGEKPFEKFLQDKVAKHIGVDIEDGFYNKSHIDIVGTAYEVPVDSNEADAVISTQVIEHLEKPVEALTEAHRLLKEGGVLFLSFPFLYPVHAAPYDFMRYTDFYIQNTLKDIGFEIVENHHVGGFWYCIALFIEIYLNGFNRGLLKKTKIIIFFRWIIQSILFLLHHLEGASLKFFGKNPQGLRRNWTVNQVLVARKICRT